MHHWRDKYDYHGCFVHHHQLKQGPSVSHTQILVRAEKFCINANVNFDGCLGAWAPLPRAPITLHSDEIGITQRLAVGPGDVIHGLCDCPGVPNPLVFNTLQDLEVLLENLLAPNPKWHLATCARVCALSRHAPEAYGCVAVQAIPSCNRFKAGPEADRIQHVVKAWEQHADQYGPIVHHATDADRKRAAAYLTLSVFVASLLSWDHLLINQEDTTVWDVTGESRDVLICSYPWLHETTSDRTTGKVWMWMADLANLCHRPCMGIAQVVNGLVLPYRPCQGLSHNGRPVPALRPPSARLPRALCPTSACLTPALRPSLAHHRPAIRPPSTCPLPAPSACPLPALCPPSACHRQALSRP
uniref:Uncharacterized protein n=1 Tax=Eutreptiella gymnastica TaxID=73025 RepID=A0A7S1JDD3_9EUGL|mmetsp:Transcript_87850/g.152871  ORF Transcript_87850/g.152871 Transcript_87850/m.152871 type:complete len:358 (+) Transcript_87850:38-1111(+)